MVYIPSYYCNNYNYDLDMDNLQFFSKLIFMLISDKWEEWASNECPGAHRHMFSCSKYGYCVVVEYTHYNKLYVQYH